MMTRTLESYTVNLLTDDVTCVVLVDTDGDAATEQHTITVEGLDRHACFEDRQEWGVLDIRSILNTDEFQLLGE